jgi:AcrR family transcriptional regulator
MSSRGRPRSFDRAEALRRAMLLFWERGYESTSIADLATAMGVHAPSLYAAFGSKEQLFKEAVDLYEDLEGDATRRAFKEPHARDAVAAMLSNNADSYSDPSTPTGCLVVLGCIGTPASPHGAGATLAERRRSDFEALRDRLEQGITAGDLPEHVDAGALAAFYVAVMQGLAIQARDGASRQDLQPVIDAAMTTWDALTAG